MRSFTGPPGLAKRRKDLTFDAHLGYGDSADFRDEFELLPVEGYLLEETVFFHRSSRTLITADMIENFETSSHFPTRMYLKAGGIHGKPGLSRPLRWCFRDKKAGRRAIDAMLAFDFERIALPHGDLIDTDAKEVMRESFTWLK